MIAVDLRDEHLKENLAAIQELKSVGFSDEEIQALYDRDIARQKEREGSDTGGI